MIDLRRLFIEWLESLAAGNETAALSERIDDSVWQGVLHQDFTDHMTRATPEAFKAVTE